MCSNTLNIAHIEIWKLNWKLNTQTRVWNENIPFVKDTDISS